MADIAVIGAGHGGLAAAARLKVKGHQVTVFELGGDGITPTSPLTLPAAYRDFFLKTGSALEKNLELVEVDSPIRVQLNNGQMLQLPGSSLGRALVEIEEKLGPAAAQQWRNYNHKLSELWISTRKNLVESEMNKSLRATVGWRNYFRFHNYRKFLLGNLTTSELIELAGAYRNLCATDSNVGVLAVNTYVHQLFGVYQPEGGLSQLTKALVTRCIELGVNFEFNSAVTPVAQETELIGIENTNGQLLAMDFVIVNNSTRDTGHIDWGSKISYRTSVERLFAINEHSWLGLGPAHAVLGGQIVAQLIGSATE